MYILFYTDADYEYCCDITIGVYSSLENIQTAIKRNVNKYREINDFYYKEIILDKDINYYEKEE